MSLFQSVEEAAIRVREQEEHQSRLSRELQSTTSKTTPITDQSPEGIIRQIVKPSSLNETVVGVDSGFVSQEMPFMDVMLVRATAAIFSYENNQLKKSNYEPTGYQFPHPQVSASNLERDEWNKAVSIQRLMHEWNLAKTCIEREKPSFCLMDGSLTPQAMDKPANHSSLMPAYQALLYLVQSTYQAARNQNCQLIGCVEDSRSKRLNEFWQENNIISKNDFSDTLLLSHALSQHERTNVLSYTKNIQEHPVLMDFKADNAKELFVFYIRPSIYDWPLRVEFLSSKEKIIETTSKVASFVLRQSMFHKEYAYPAVLIEADLKSRLTSSEIELVMDQLYQKMGSTSQLTKRRDHRPFG